MIDERIEKLRRLMIDHNIDAYIIPGSDAHQDEYLPEMWKRREWISGFTGSAGTVIITGKHAGLWTDSRYFLQAETQLQGSQMVLYRLGTQDTLDPWEWLKYTLEPGACVGIDPQLITYQAAKHARKLFQSRNIGLKFIEINLVDVLWTARPGFPLHPAVPHLLVYSGESVSNKLQLVREELKKENCNVLILSRLDAVAWLFNIRGGDIPYNPLVISYALVFESEARIYLKKEKITEELSRHLAGCASLRDYSDFKSDLLACNAKQFRFQVDGKTISAWIIGLLDKKRTFFLECPIQYFKAVKNQTEIENFKHAHLCDGVAMVKFLKWLEDNIPSGTVTEDRAASQLVNFRSRSNLYKEESFPAISAYKEHGAIVHYAHTKESNAVLQGEGIYLIDSGAHYLDGTTDITRTIALGTPAAEQKECFTLVLQGHIELATAVFPEGTQGIQLDTLARKPLWDYGLDYGHGTGHGIGSYMTVHEGPHAIAQHRGVRVKLQEGMFCSNEPGYYKVGEFGIRIENVMYVTRDKKRSIGNQIFYRFQTITLCPIDSKLINKELLNDKQIMYINQYHQTILKELSPLLDENEKEWLEKATASI